MLLQLEDLGGYTIGAADGDIGEVDDFHFDDQSWAIRYLAVDTGGWLTGRHVLIPPRAVQGIDAAGQRLVTNLTKQQVKDSPGLDSALPVSRQYERDLYGYYGYPYYWVGPYLWGPIAFPSEAPPAMYEAAAAASRGATDEPQDASLRSARDVRGHGIRATDGELGHVEDYIIDSEAWAIRYVIVDPRNWWPGQHVLVSTEWITGVDWDDRTLEVNVTKEAVRNAPAYDRTAPLEREYETRYHGYYGRPGYWERHPDEWRRSRRAA